jgi:hypothetical protein
MPVVVSEPALGLALIRDEMELSIEEMSTPT